MEVDFDVDGNKTLAVVVISLFGTLRFFGVFAGVWRPNEVFVWVRERRVLTSSSSDDSWSSGSAKVARLTFLGDLLGDMEVSSSGDDGGGERVACDDGT